MHFTNNLDIAIRNLYERGAFLTVKHENEINTMTIGWGTIGYQWGKPVFVVLVRKHRHTFNLIDNTDNFTVTIPLDDSLKSELSFCGTKSGRDFDKFKECNLELKSGNTINTPIINKPNTLTYECKIVYKQEMNSEFLDSPIKNSAYPREDYHVLYYGEILDCYKL